MPLLGGAGGRGGIESARRAWRRNANKARKAGRTQGDSDNFIQVVFRDESSDVGPNLEALFQMVASGDIVAPIARALAVKTSEYMTQEADEFSNTGELATSFQIREVPRGDGSTSFEVFSEIAYAATWTHEEGEEGTQGKPPVKNIIDWMLSLDQDWYLMDDGEPIEVDLSDYGALNTIAYLIRTYISKGYPPKSGRLYDLSDGHRMYDYITAAWTRASEEAEDYVQGLGEMIVNEFG